MMVVECEVFCGEDRRKVHYKRPKEKEKVQRTVEWKETSALSEEKGGEERRKTLKCRV